MQRDRKDFDIMKMFYFTVYNDFRDIASHFAVLIKLCFTNECTVLYCLLLQILDNSGIIVTVLIFQFHVQANY